MPDAHIRKFETEFTPARLGEFFVCDPVAGLLFWKPRPGDDYRVRTWNKRFAGRVAGRKNTAGHVQITLTIGGARWHSVAHRVIWAMATGRWPDGDLDHRNVVYDDNRLSNLRPAKAGQNKANSNLYKSNTSGFKGVSRAPRMAGYYAIVGVAGSTEIVGHFAQPRDAAEAYDIAAVRLHGEFARTNRMLGLL